MRRAFLLPVLFGLAGLAAAQQEQPAAPVPPKVVDGAVTGHVYCADTNAPARFAYITLEPVRDVEDFNADARKDGEQHGAAVNSIQTMLDGSFVVRNVKPGQYYLIADMPGYLSPLAQFTNEDWDKPTPEVKERLATLLPRVTVQSNQTANADVQLQRGGAISGTVSFDDGSPAPGQRLRVLRRAKDGKWAPVRLGATAWRAPGNSDDLGHYRIPGLPAGEYLMQVDLELNTISASSFLGSSFSSMQRSFYTLPIYAGGAVRQRDAKPVKLGGGDEQTGADIVVPLAKLHTVSGTLTAERDGHVLNSGKVSLLFADDKTELTSAEIDKDDDSFHFAFVPEGEYLLRTSSAADVTREEVPSAPGVFPASETKETTVHTYGTGEEPLTVRGDMTSLALPVPEKDQKQGATTTAEAPAEPQ